MHSDFALETGDSHKICEDYGRANNAAPGFPFTIVCDGCSDERSPDVDFGARLLTKSVENFILVHVGVKNADIVNPAIAQAAAQAKGLGLNPQCLDCTLMIARVVKDGDKPVVQVDCWGDGSIIAIRKDGTMEVFEITYPAGYPFYPNYLTDASRMVNFAKVGEKVIHAFTIAPDGKTTALPDEVSQIPDTHRTFDIAAYNYVAVTSDGIESFSADGKAGRTPQPAIEMAKGLGGFKNSSGQFVQRRFNAFMKDARSKNISHHDDITVGAIYLGE